MLVHQSIIRRQQTIHFPFPGQVCIVTGGDSGIGRSLAAMFARESAKCVAIVYLDKEQKVGARRGVEGGGAMALLERLGGTSRNMDLPAGDGSARIH